MIRTLPAARSPTGLPGASIRRPAGWPKANLRRLRAATTSASPAIVAPARRPGTARIATSSACLRSTPSPRSPRAPAERSGRAPAARPSLPSPSSPERTSASGRAGAEARPAAPRLPGRLVLKRERPGGGRGPEWPKRTAASSLIGVRPSRLLPLLDCRRSGGWGENARMAIIPADSKPWGLLLEHLLDDASAYRLGDPLRLDDDRVSRLCGHSLLTSSATPSRLYSAIMQREGGSR